MVFNDEIASDDIAKNLDFSSAKRASRQEVANLGLRGIGSAKTVTGNGGKWELWHQFLLNDNSINRV